jgi:hypothetical protein
VVPAATPSPVHGVPGRTHIVHARGRPCRRSASAFRPRSTPHISGRHPATARSGDAAPATRRLARRRNPLQELRLRRRPDAAGAAVTGRANLDRTICARAQLAAAP